MGFDRNEISNNAKGGTELMRDLLESRLDSNLLDTFQIIMSRPRKLNNDKIRIIQVHDLPQDPESSKFADDSWVSNFHKIVFISNWQYQQYQNIHNLQYSDKHCVIETGIEKAPFDAIRLKPTNQIRLVYTSTPQRGLDIAVYAFGKLAHKYPNVHFDVFSSFKIYGWDDADQQFEPLYDTIRNHKQMTYHGFVPNLTVRQHLLDSHIHAYPCTWPETSCRAMLEAMSAGLLCVHPNYAGLPDTSGSMNMMYQGSSDRQHHANIFTEVLDNAIQRVIQKDHFKDIRLAKDYCDRRFDINKIADQWENMLHGLLEKYPDQQSRRANQPMFEYKIM